MPLSGAQRYQGNGADMDVYAFGSEEAPLVCEVKARAGGKGFVQLERLGAADREGKEVSTYSVSAVAKVNGKVLLRFRGPNGFALAFEMGPAEARRLADDIIRLAEREADNMLEEVHR